MVFPVRIRLSRKNGFDLHAYSKSINGLPAINVSRPSYGTEAQEAFEMSESGFEFQKRLIEEIADELRVHSEFGPSAGANHTNSLAVAEGVLDIVKGAIIARERERCARLAEFVYADDIYANGKSIAEAIRTKDIPRDEGDGTHPNQMGPWS